MQLKQREKPNLVHNNNNSSIERTAKTYNDASGKLIVKQFSSNNDQNGNNSSMYKRINSIQKNLMTNSTSKESSNSLLHKSQNYFDDTLKRKKLNNSDSLLLNNNSFNYTNNLTTETIKTINTVNNSYNDNDTNRVGLVYPLLSASQQATKHEHHQLHHDECLNQIVPSSTFLNCTSQDIYDNIDFHPEDINFSDMQDLWIVKEPLNILFRVLLVAPIVLLGILGNLTIIYSMFKFKPFRSKPTNIFILNMAIADLLTTMVCPNAALFTYIYQFYVLGSFICRIEGFVKITCFLVSSYSLIVLSSDWLLCVVQPCRKRITIKQSWITLIIIWILSVIMATPLFIWRKLRHRQWKDLVEVWCCELIQYSKYYWVVINFFLIYLPTFFMTIVLVIILAQMDKFEAKLRRSRTSQSNVSLTINMKYRRRIVKILFTYLLISIICWTPLQVFIIYRHFRSESKAAPWFFEFNFFTSLSASLTAATNPIIFGFLSQPFRKLVTKSLMFKFLDKLMTTNNNSENRQHEIHVMNNHNHHHQQHHHHHIHHNNKPNNQLNIKNNNNCQTSQKNIISSRSPQSKKLRRHPSATNTNTNTNIISRNYKLASSLVNKGGTGNQSNLNSIQHNDTNNNSNAKNTKLNKTVINNSSNNNNNHHHTITDNTTNNSFRNNQTTGYNNNITSNKRVSFNTVTSQRNPIINYLPSYGLDNSAYESQEFDNNNINTTKINGRNNYRRGNDINFIKSTDHNETKLSRHNQNDVIATINTTSFIRRTNEDDLTIRPMSVVSMDSINIEENITTERQILDQINNNQDVDNDDKDVDDVV